MATFMHEIIEFQLKGVTKIYRILINNLINWYEEKEDFIDFLTKLLEIKALRKHNISLDVTDHMKKKGASEFC